MPLDVLTQLDEFRATWSVYLLLVFIYLDLIKCKREMIWFSVAIAFAICGLLDIASLKLLSKADDFILVIVSKYLMMTACLGGMLNK